MEMESSKLFMVLKHLDKNLLVFTLALGLGPGWKLGLGAEQKESGQRLGSKRFF